jgi:hypothetical protein
VHFSLDGGHNPSNTERLMFNPTYEYVITITRTTTKQLILYNTDPTYRLEQVIKWMNIRKTAEILAIIEAGGSIREVIMAVWPWCTLTITKIKF